METKKFIRLTMFLALAVVLNIIESLIPIFNFLIPGVKLGLSNVIILTVLYVYGFKDAMYLSILKVFLVGILRTGLFSVPFFFSLAGAIISIVMMYLFKKIKLFSIIGISIIGSISHSVGQVLVAIFVINIKMIYYLPILLIISIPTGILVGIISQELIKYIKET